MKQLLAVASILGFVFVGHLISTSIKADTSERFHTDLELMQFSVAGLTMDSTFMFSGSGVCVECHGHDTTGWSNYTEEGEDINVVDDWRATMMANSAKDPLWRAKVSHEGLVNPAHQTELESKCTSCHAPMGHFEAMHSGQTSYTIAELETDSLALDGVSCLGCHKQSPDSAGLFFGGDLVYDTLKNAYGPYISPLASPMVAATGYWPLHHNFISESEACAGCHTLITNTVDLDGNSTGGEFVEQATYHEWVNSAYNGTQSCQNCHMPKHFGEVYIVTGFPDIPSRFEFSKHHFAGANSFMLKMMKEHRNELGISATEAHFDSVIARTNRLLTQESLDLAVQMTNRTIDTAFFTVDMTNKAGHKFPSGYPSRRVVLQMLVTDEAGDTLFGSGLMDEGFELPDQNATYEPHYDLINSEDEVQIYEIVMGDVNGDVTTVLERADHPLKDNRFVPLGFSNSHPSYDTTELAGTVLSDLNFNNNGTAGSGTDQIRYHVPLDGYTGQITASVRVLYQALPLKWNEEMFNYSSAEIDTFKNMFFGSDREPVVVADTTLIDGVISTEALPRSEIQVFPNPTQNFVFVSGHDIKQIQLIDVNGKSLISQTVNSEQTRLDISDVRNGVYLVITKDSAGLETVTKIVKR